MAKTMFFKILNATLSASHMLRYRDQQNIINKKEMEREREGGRKTAAIRLAQHYDIIYNNYYINIFMSVNYCTDIGGMLQYLCYMGYGRYAVWCMCQCACWKSNIIVPKYSNFFFQFF
uniref:Uncharacterized protein n=1 Tax=Cacopsylla melanoneura TaxID=428564 RepID=A0A8D8W6J7_9HEMI